MGNINPRSKNISEDILRILNETYEEFIEKYGEKHSQYIKEKLEELTEEGKIEQSEIYYQGPIAMAKDSIVYTPYKNLAGVLKHEIWHTLNREINGKKSKSIFDYIPEKYKEISILEDIIKKNYEQLINNIKKRGVKKFTITYSEFKKNYRLQCEDEKWTEWFNQKTHTKSSNNQFWNFENGFFTQKRSWGSIYDSYTNICDIISCIVPTEKLLDMFLSKNEYNTDYSYSQMIDEFDHNYADALDEKEKETYKYPYLKILMDTKKISEEPIDVARQTLQDCFKTCFKAYLLKLQKIKNIDINSAKQIYSEIKYMQENMMWNIDTSKMKDLEYIKVLVNIQDKFKNMISNLEKEHPEVKEMIQNVDYEKENTYEIVEDGMNISKLIQSSIIIPRKKLFTINNYKTTIGNNGIKGNLYASMAYIFGNKTVNLLFKNFQEDILKTGDENILLKFHSKIQEANTKEDYVEIYNELYELFAKQLDDTLNTDENIDNSLRKYGNAIINLQKYGFFNEKNEQYLPSLEKVISIYKNKIEEYKEKIDISTEKAIIKLINCGYEDDKIKEFHYRCANNYKNTLQDRVGSIDMQRKQQSHEYKEIILEDQER